MATVGRARALLPINRSPRTPTIVTPKTAAEWDKLMRVVIELADSQGDRRIHGLRKALVDGKSERVLRMMGIIHMGDLPRVFPAKD
jgi:hypothetical protein